MNTETERKEDKAMSTISKTRRAHDLLDELDARAELSQEQEKLLRSFLPELPKQKTLKELYSEVYDVWVVTDGNEWPDDVYGDLETWLSELYAQLKGLKDVPANTPALPAGMRLADHEEYGRCVVSPNADESNDAFRIFYVDEAYVTDSFSRYVETSSLTFIDAEPAKLAHPEFLETEADYQNAPEGTIVACEDSPPWHKFDSTWLSTITHGRNDAKRMTGIIRCVLRWGWA